MRLASFNLESLDVAPKGGPALEERIAVLRPQLERIAADILCLQEVNGQKLPGRSERSLDALERLLAGTPYAGFERASTRGHDGRGVLDVHNLVVLSRWPLRTVRELHHELVDGPLYRRVTAQPPDTQPQPVRWDRPVLAVEVALPDGRLLHLFNVHLRAPLASAIPGRKTAPFVWTGTQSWAEGFFLSAIKRAGQALELRLAIDRIFDIDAQALIAVCGDFNAEDHESPLRIVIAAEEDTGSGRLAARTLVPLERSMAADRRFSVLHHGRPMMLDHILVSRSLLAHFERLEIHNETLTDELVSFTKVDRPPDSMHAPLLAQFDRP